MFDALLKGFGNRLLGSRGIDLRRLGWWDYLHSEDHPAIDEAHALFDAFAHISLEESGDWNNTMPVVLAVLATIDHYRKSPMPQADKEWLRDILEENPVDKSKLEDWFIHVLRQEVLQ